MYCICGNRWCQAREVCTYAWIAVDREEGAYHTKSAALTHAERTFEYEQYRTDQQARRIARQRRQYVPDASQMNEMIRQWLNLAIPAQNRVTDPF